MNPVTFLEKKGYPRPGGDYDFEHAETRRYKQLKREAERKRQEARDAAETERSHGLKERVRNLPEYGGKERER